MVLVTQEGDVTDPGEGLGRGQELGVLIAVQA